MSKNLPYRDDWPDDLPLPDEEASWQKMKRLLDKEDKRRRLLPFWAWRYGLLALLLAGGTAGGYFLLNESRGKKTVIVPAKGRTQPQKEEGQAIKEREPERETSSTQNITIAQKKEQETITTDRTILQKKEQRVYKKSLLQKTERKVKKEASVTEPLFGGKLINNDPVAKKEAKSEPVSLERKSTIAPSNSTPPKRLDSIAQVDVSKPAGDSAGKTDSVKTMATPPVASTPKKAKKKNRFLWSAGVGLQQPIALGGQRWSLNDSTGRQSRLLDLIPLVYLRLQKGRWALQGEAYYKVSQPVKPFSFSQATTYDAGNAVLRTERLSVQKLHYRQALVSINRFVTPRWSLGAGGTYNLLASAIAERETKHINLTTGNEAVSKSLVSLKGYIDSFLYRSTAGLLLQTDYHHKRLSIGLRYSRNLQPFIKYTKPDGAVLQEKNGLVQAVLRFRLAGRE